MTSGRPSSAAIVAIGSEMLGPLRQDTNSLWLSARLDEIGIPVVRKSIVGDDPALLAEELDSASRAAPLVVTTGGLGPTADDVTVAAVAAWLPAELERNEEFVARMRARFERRGIAMPACNEKQADFIAGARVLENPNGTAPGFWARRGETDVVILPGVPSEMKEIFDNRVLPELREAAGGIVGRRRVLRIAGMGESAVEELVAPVYAKWKDDPVTILASPGEVQLHLAVRGEADMAEARLAAMEKDFRAVLGDRIFGADGEDLPSAVGRLLREARATIALAESCTGGLASSMLTDVPGSSEYFLGSVVSYADDAKANLLGVSADTLARHGAVSAESAAEMARGARERFGSDYAVSITGIAGPDGGSAEKPVGTVFFVARRPQRAGSRKEATLHRRPGRDSPGRGHPRARARPAAAERIGRRHVRAFLAVPVDPAWADSVARWTAGLKASLPRAAWTRREAWHLTLKFLGEIPRATADRLAAELAPVAERARALELEPGGPVVFPPRGRPRVVGLGFAPSADLEALESLAASAEAAVRRAGLPPEDRALHPHVTLARLREPWPAAALETFRTEAAAWPLPAWKARECVLFESRLEPGGAVHTPLHRLAFAGAREEVRA